MPVGRLGMDAWGYMHVSCGACLWCSLCRNAELIYMLVLLLSASSAPDPVYTFFFKVRIYGFHSLPLTAYLLVRLALHDWNLDPWPSPQNTQHLTPSFFISIHCCLLTKLLQLLLLDNHWIGASPILSNKFFKVFCQLSSTIFNTSLLKARRQFYIKKPLLFINHLSHFLYFLSHLYIYTKDPIISLYSSSYSSTSGSTD